MQQCHDTFQFHAKHALLADLSFVFLVKDQCQRLCAEAVRCLVAWENLAFFFTSGVKLRIHHSFIASILQRSLLIPRSCLQCNDATKSAVIARQGPAAAAIATLKRRKPREAKPLDQEHERAVF